MKNKDKYYTPDIEEFYVGFECEVEERGIGSTYWSKQVIDSGEEIDIIFKQYEELDDADIRVKYLDQEDIESLGFTLHRLTPGLITYIKGDYKIHQFIVERKLSILQKDSRTGKYLHTIFRGTIKNKSELKVLLKQLGI